MRLLDFRKIKQKERQEAVDLFKSKKGKEILKEIAKKAKIAPNNVAINETNNSKGTTIFGFSFKIKISLCNNVCKSQF